MNVELGAHVRTRDGQDVGVVDKLIWDPGAGRVKAVAIRKGFILRRDVEVPVVDLRAGPDGGLRLDCTADQIDELPRFDESSYTTPPVDYAPPVGVPSAGLLWPVGYTPAVTPVAAERGVDAHVRAEIASALYRADFENEVIGEGSTVKSRDGEKVGEVHRLSFDPETGQLTGLVVRRGFLFTEDVEVPASLVAAVGDEVVHLNLDASDLRAPRAS